MILQQTCCLILGYLVLHNAGYVFTVKRQSRTKILVKELLKLDLPYYDAPAPNRLLSNVCLCLTSVWRLSVCRVHQA